MLAWCLLHHLFQHAGSLWLCIPPVLGPLLFSVIGRRLKEAAEREEEIRAAQAEVNEARTQLAARAAEVGGLVDTCLCCLPAASACAQHACLSTCIWRRLARPL